LISVKRKSTTAHAFGPHPLDAVPLRVPGVETRTGADGALHLRRATPSCGRLDAFFRRVLHNKTDVRLSIDPNGKRFWDLVDGRRTLREIATRLAATFELSESTARDSVLLFTGVLMQRHFLAVEVPKQPNPSQP